VISLKFKKPKKKCNDINCPFHGNLSIRGRILDGVVVSSKMDKTAIVRRNFLHYVPRFKRYERRQSRVPCHNPQCIAAKEGNRVKIAECRPISKTVSFVVVEKLEEN
jgi:small subunit ribosomal protein S17